MRAVFLAAALVLSLVACGTEDDVFVDAEAPATEEAALEYGRPTADDAECRDTNAVRCNKNDTEDEVTTTR